LFPGEAGDPVAGYDELLRSTAVDAFIVTDTLQGDSVSSWLRSRRAPFVAFGRPWENPEGATHPWVDIDSAAGAALATEHLIEKGHTRIAWIGWRREHLVGEERRSGWSRAMHAHSLPTTGLASRVEDTIASGRAATAALLNEAAPTAFVCASDTLALGVLHELHARGLRPGEDIAVTGFDDSIAAQTVPPGLTSVRQPLEDAAAELVKALEGLQGPVGSPEGILLQPTLVARGSS
ncbi:MAG: substrate-binding domain-containing protein, partial [Nocardioides sp.]